MGGNLARGEPSIIKGLKFKFTVIGCRYDVGRHDPFPYNFLFIGLNTSSDEKDEVLKISIIISQQFEQYTWKMFAEIGV